ncbi:unnamed protein product [Durusdinium trenchii]|uniref:Cytochrome c-553 n=2 Tax=Durusdinium trenchii TaxID=1381693 RepID=A0ABP0Q9A4_9DINO
MSRVASIVSGAALVLFGAGCFVVPSMPRSAPEQGVRSVATESTKSFTATESSSWSPLAIGAAFGLLAAVVTAQPVLAADLENGEAVFQGNCTACHAGGNNSIVAEKKLKKDALVTYGKYDVGAIIKQVTNGNGSMPAFGDKLGPDDIEDVANYVYNKADKWRRPVDRGVRFMPRNGSRYKGLAALKVRHNECRGRPLGKQWAVQGTGQEAKKKEYDMCMDLKVNQKELMNASCDGNFSKFYNKVVADQQGRKTWGEGEGRLRGRRISDHRAVGSNAAWQQPCDSKQVTYRQSPPSELPLVHHPGLGDVDVEGEKVFWTISTPHLRGPVKRSGQIQLDGEMLQGRQIQVDEHVLEIYMAKRSADDLDPDDVGTHAMAFILLHLERSGCLKHRTLLDMGCGTGFLGLLAARGAGAKVVLSDRPGRSLELARLNGSAAGAGEVEVKALAWGSDLVDETEGAVYDVVLLSEVLYVAQPSCVPWSLDDADLLALAEMTKAKLSAEGHLSQRKGRPPAELYWFLVGSDQILCESHVWVTYGNRENGGAQFAAAAAAAGLAVEERRLEEFVPAELLQSRAASALRRVKVFHLQHAGYLIEQFDYFSTLVADYEYAERLCFNRTRRRNRVLVSQERAGRVHGDFTAECDNFQEPG